MIGECCLFCTIFISEKNKPHLLCNEELYSNIWVSKSSDKIIQTYLIFYTKTHKIWVIIQNEPTLL